MVSGPSLVQSLLSLSLSNPLANPTAANLTHLFGPHLSPAAQIILPTETAWRTEVQARWTDYQAPTYLGAVKPATEGDVQRIVSGCLCPKFYLARACEREREREVEGD